SPPAPRRQSSRARRPPRAAAPGVPRRDRRPPPTPAGRARRTGGWSGRSSPVHRRARTPCLAVPRRAGAVITPRSLIQWGMRFMHPERDELLELSLDDVFLVPGYFDGMSRLDVDLTPIDFRGGSHPIVSSNMNAVTGKRMAETMARFGGLGVLPQDMDLDT